MNGWCFHTVIAKTTTTSVVNQLCIPSLKK